MKNYSKEFLLKLYRSMLTIRMCEESMVDPILNGDIKCPVHLYSGEEAIATGICAALSPSDYIFGNHRSHGHYLAKGGDMNAMIAEIYGKSGGCARGRGGSMHVIDTNVGMLGAAPIVAGTISLAVGAAMAIKIKKEKGLAVSFFGDGAAGEGVLYEAMNLAALRKLPVLFICENNFYSTHMPILECRLNDNICTVGHACETTNYRIDGNDVLNVYETALKAVEQCRNGNGPAFIECATYRLRGHVGPDDNIQGTHTDIRPEEEILRWKKKDPIVRFRDQILSVEMAEEIELENIKSDIEAAISKAYQFAHSNPYPDENELMKYVFK